MTDLHPEISGSCQQTRISSIFKHVSGQDVIEFSKPPKYRNCIVEVETNNNKLVLHKRIEPLKGNNKGGNRATVDCTGVKRNKCKVIVEDDGYKIHENFTGKISIGIEKV